MADYSFVVDSSYNPFTLQEMLVPFTAYKEAFEKSEEAYNDLSDKSDKFKYLSETLPEGSKARELYEGYANDLRAQAEDLAHNGLTMGNRRALTSMKRRYQGEIGRLSQADEAMREEKKLRQTLNAQDPSRLYATDNLSIDDFLDGNNPNLYSVSGNDLYTRGAAAGKAASSRVFSAGDAGSTLNGYYRDYVQKMGYSADTIRRFYEDMSTIPELQMEADAILKEKGVYGNLTGVNLERARQSVINGMIDGAVYQESHAPQRDLGVLTKAEELQDKRQEQGLQITLHDKGYKFDDKGNIIDDPDSMAYKIKDATIEAQKAKAFASGRGRGAAYDSVNARTVMVGRSGKNYLAKDDTSIYGEHFGGKPLTVRELTTAEVEAMFDDKGNWNKQYEFIKNAIGDGDIGKYRISVIPMGTEIDGSGFFSDDRTTEDIFIIEPRNTGRARSKDEENSYITGNSTGTGTGGTYQTDDAPKQ